LLHLFGCLHRCTSDARSHKHQIILCYWSTLIYESVRSTAVHVTYLFVQPGMIQLQHFA